jgi:hypothetical protein
VGVAAFFGRFLAEGWFRQSGVVSSRPPDKRYDSCEELRVMVLHQPLPQEAIDALNSAMKDSNPAVADAAQRALALHTEIGLENNQKFSDKKTVRFDWRLALLWLLLGVILLCGFFWYLQYICYLPC